MQKPRPWLSIPIIDQVRRNHALEHATLQILARKIAGRRMMGYSDPYGFWIIGDLPIQTIREAATEANSRLKDGEERLAIHPYCGTNYAIAGWLAGSAAWLAMLGSGEGFRRKLDRLPLVVTLVIMAIMAAQPLGVQVQRHVTTLADLKGMEIVGIDCCREIFPVVHRVRTRREV